MYELLTGFRPFRASNLSKLLHQIVYATPPPIHTLRADIPEQLEQTVAMCMQKEPEKRFKTGVDLAADLTRIFQGLKKQNDRVDKQQRYETLRRLRFFHEFSHAEIWELLRASDWHDYENGEEIVREGERDDRFYVIVRGGVHVEQQDRVVGKLGPGDCFGESSYVLGARRTATIRAADTVALICVSSSLLEQASSACQLRFNKVFLRTLIRRLQSAERLDLEVQ